MKFESSDQKVSVQRSLQKVEEAEFRHVCRVSQSEASSGRLVNTFTAADPLFFFFFPWLALVIIKQNQSAF